MYKATVNVTLRKSILDPQGKAAHHALKDLGLTNIEEVRIGKLIELNIDADDKDTAFDIAETACTKLLANEVMEDFEITIHEN
ncbi:phosphoribosylformylglycinamidine synthase subunit PurS [Aliifodinibius salicampi]|uniref:Phosphoribosylformylglycinamidine synthase subunit PurS n=1 Tax=Fodinibius salicampi TaxID=1920655 RepID=A0ABT3Q0U4_9BACT|nr:phosphoribosylformylglycinamidine synthase subunit PurS [Fodinibius salicampi]MCW9713725.1 phosphoribosylformylglycinamidine synthase subunit PurS [Fodinibius salicampi]